MQKRLEDEMMMRSSSQMVRDEGAQHVYHPAYVEEAAEQETECTILGKAELLFQNASSINSDELKLSLAHAKQPLFRAFPTICASNFHSSSYRYDLVPCRILGSQSDIASLQAMLACAAPQQTAE